jgi:hypothetical protein
MAREGGDMSNLEPIKRRVPGDWWNIAATFQALVVFIPNPHPNRPIAGYQHDLGWVVTVYGGEIPLGTLGRVAFSGRDAWTDITAMPATPKSVEYWTEALDRLQNYAHTARDIRQEAVGATIEEAIEDYYAAKARGWDVTIRQFAESRGLNYGYFRKRKAIYDKNKKARNNATDKEPD